MNSDKSAIYYDKKSGFTLLELLIGLALIGIVLTAVLSIMLKSSSASSQVQLRSELLSETQLAQNYMVSKLREAAFVFPASNTPSIPSTFQLNTVGYTTYNPFNGTGNYTWRVGIDPMIAFVVPPRTVNAGSCATASVASRAELCYAFYAFYAIPRSQITRGVPAKSIGPASGPNFLAVNSINDDTAWIIMEYRAYYSTQGFSKSTGNIPNNGNALALLDFIRPPTASESLFSQAPNPTNFVVVNLAAQQNIGGQSVLVPSSGRYSVRVYPRNLGNQLLN